MSSTLNRSERVHVLLVCLLALLVRAWGIDWGLPRVDLNPDELMVLEITRGIDWEDLDPEFYNYGGLTFHLYFFATEAARTLGLEATDAGQLLVHRWVGLLLATLTTLLTYRIARRLKLDHVRSLTATFLFALLPLHVWDTHFAVADIGLSFWTTLALWLALRAYDEPGLGRFVLGGLAVGAAMGTKFNGALAGGTFIAAAALVWWEGRRSPWQTIRNLFAAGAVSLLAFAALSPYSIIHFDQTWAALSFEWYAVRSGHYGFDMSADGWQYHRGLYQLVALFPFAFGVALWPITLFGAFWFTWRGTAAQRALGWSHLALQLYAAASWTFVPLRYYLPVLPMLAIFAGTGLDAIRRSRRLPRAVAWGVPATVVLYTSVFTATTTLRFTHDTRVQAGEWADANLPRGAEVYLLYPVYEHSYMPRFTRDDIVAQSVPLEDARVLARKARNAPGRTRIVLTGLTYLRDYREGANARVERAPRRQHRHPDPISQWEFIRDNPDVFELEKRFSAWYLNKDFYTWLDPMFDGYFVSPTIEFYRSVEDREQAIRRHLRQQEQRDPGNSRSDGDRDPGV